MRFQRTLHGRRKPRGRTRYQIAAAGDILGQRLRPQPRGNAIELRLRRARIGDKRSV